MKRRIGREQEEQHKLGRQTKGLTRMDTQVLCSHRLHLRTDVHAVTGAPTHGEDLAHVLRVVGKGPEVVDSQDAIEDQAVVADVCIQGQHLDQL